MNWQRIGLMVRLRYKLLWAKTRSRNGKIALFAAGYLLLVLVLILLGAGGLGAAMLAIRSGQAELVAQAVLGGLYVQALFGTIMLGFGMNAVFTETELRRYPLNAQERLLTRHLIGIVDPFWFLILALELGLAVGLMVLGNFNVALIVAAILLLFVSNYLLARVIGMALEGLTTRKSGSAFLLVLVMLLAFLPGTLMPLLVKNKANVERLLSVLCWTPPFGAAAAMTHTGTAALNGLFLLLVWLAALVSLLVFFEKRPPRTQAAATTELRWDNPFDRAGALLGAKNGPLIAFWLRFYVRNNRFRALYCLTVPILVFLTFQFRNGFERRHDPGAPIDPNHLFVAALGTIFAVSFFGCSRFTVNQFGYTGGGFRRFFLLPTDPGASMRAGNFTSMLCGLLLVPVALVLFAIFGGPFDPRKFVMLLGSAFSGLFFLHGAGLWVTLFNPRKGKYATAVGNDMSLMGNLVVIVGMLGALFTPQILSKVLPAAVSPENWWDTVALAAVGFAFYVISLRATTTLFPAKREELLAIVEGRTT